METKNYVFFCGHNETNIGKYFSQWYPAKFVEKFDNETNISFENAEQYMMAHKALLFGDSKNFDKIMATTDPAKIKQFGREIKNFDEAEWNKHKYDIVIEGNRLKFQQNPIMMEYLLATGYKTIVEAAHYDKVWGIGMRAEQAVNIPENQWPGENLLGRALMVV
jgi:hypothetical protein